MDCVCKMTIVQTNNKKQITTSKQTTTCTRTEQQQQQQRKLYTCTYLRIENRNYLLVTIIVERLICGFNGLLRNMGTRMLNLRFLRDSYVT